MARGRFLYHNMQDRILGNSYEYEGHWLWSGAVNEKGYGKISIWDPVKNKHSVRTAHRVSYAAFMGPVPADKDVDHFNCPYRCCVHPNCLRLLDYKIHRALTGIQGRTPPQQLALLK